MDATAAFYQALAESEAEDAAAALAAAKPTRRNRRTSAAVAVPSPLPVPDHANQPHESINDGGAETYEFRWDVEVPGGERRYGQKFMKQWKRVLQVQKMSPLVSAKLAAHHARFQLCVAPETVGASGDGLASPAGGAITNPVSVCEAEIAEELSRFRWADGGTSDGHIEGEPARQHPAGWQGVRVWMTFARHDVEAVLGKKPKI